MLHEYKNTNRIMKYLFSLLLALLVSLPVAADNFIIQHGQTFQIFVSKTNGADTQRADQLFVADYQEVFGSYISHTNRAEDARIVVGSYNNPDIKRYAKLRGLNFDALAGRKESFILKVHNNGKQLFVVGSDDRGTAFGLMTLSRIWGVSPFRWWLDVPALPLDNFELGVAYEELFQPTIPTRTLILNGAQDQEDNLQNLLLRLRVSKVTNSVTAASDTLPGVFRWNLNPSLQPYLGLNLALDHPERIRLEGLRAVDHKCLDEWQLLWGHQLGGELQMLLFFDMAWNAATYRDPYAVDKLEDRHYQQTSGLANSWSRLWNDFFDLTMMFRPDQPLGIEALRRGIGESQSLGLQLSLDLSEKVVASPYTNAFFRTVEYPLNMASSQMQRLCNMQLVRHEMAKPWAVDDCKQRMELLASELPGLVAPKWRQMMGAIQMPSVILGQSLMRADGYRMTQLEVGSDELPNDEATALLYRSSRAIGTVVEPFEPFRLPLNYQADSLHLCVSLMPVKNYGKHARCMVMVDNKEAQLIDVPADAFPDTQYVVNLTFALNPEKEEHQIVFRTQSDGIYLQRVWVTDMQPE